jgi:hypothetical protein
MPQKETDRLNPSERTRALFAQNYDVLAEALQDQVVRLQGTDRLILLTQLQAWSKDRVGKSFPQMRAMYWAMRGMNPGDWCSYHIPLRRMRQSLIVAPDAGEIGACIRIVQANRFDCSRNAFIQMSREGEIADFFGLADNEKAQLKFLTKSNVLYLVRSGQVIEPVRLEGKPSPEDAGKELDILLES